MSDKSKKFKGLDYIRRQLPMSNFYPYNISASSICVAIPAIYTAPANQFPLPHISVSCSSTTFTGGPSPTYQNVSNPKKKFNLDCFYSYRLSNKDKEFTSAYYSILTISAPDGKIKNIHPASCKGLTLQTIWEF